jgi:hypothetical protein
VYSRCLSEAPSGGLQLVRVASYPPSGPAAGGLMPGLEGGEDTIVLRTVSGLCGRAAAP